jgi:hypothetical protein
MLSIIKILIEQQIFCQAYNDIKISCKIKISVKPVVYIKIFIFAENILSWSELTSPSCRSITTSCCIRQPALGSASRESRSGTSPGGAPESKL